MVAVYTVGLHCGVCITIHPGTLPGFFTALHMLKQESFSQPVCFHCLFSSICFTGAFGIEEQKTSWGVIRKSTYMFQNTLWPISPSKQCQQRDPLLGKCSDRPKVDSCCTPYLYYRCNVAGDLHDKCMLHDDNSPSVEEPLQSSIG